MSLVSLLTYAQPSGRETGQMSKLLQQLAILSKNTQYPGESREGHPAPPVRPLSATSHGLPFVAAVHHEGPLPETSTVGDDAAATVPGVSTAIQMMNIGEGVPVVRRHSYSMGGKDKPRCESEKNCFKSVPSRREFDGLPLSEKRRVSAIMSV